MSRDRAKTPWRPPEVAALTAVLLMAACSDPATAPPSLDFVAEPAHLWAGGLVSLAVTNGAFRSGDVVLRATDTLAVVTGAPTSVAFRIPSDANGPISLEVRRDGVSLGEAAIEVYGFVAQRVYPARMDEIITELSLDGSASVVARSYSTGIGDQEGGFSWIFPATGVHRTFEGTAGLATSLYRVGVDPRSGVVYYEWDEADPAACSFCETVHAGRIVGGELVDLGWLFRPFNRWSAEPLDEDIWLVPTLSHTCRVIEDSEGDRCETIEPGGFSTRDVWGIERLTSAGTALVVSFQPAAFRLSTGELAFRLSDEVSARSAAPDEARSSFWLSAVIVSTGAGRSNVILRVSGEDGTVEGTFALEAACPADAVLPSSCEEPPDIAYDAARDALYLMRRDTGALEVRDAATLERIGDIALPERPDLWLDARVLVDEPSGRLLVVYAGAGEYNAVSGFYDPVPGTPVMEVRLPPTG